MNYVYMLKCADDTLYIGSTNDLEKRLHAHNNLKTGAKYTRGRRPVEMVYTEEIEGDIGDARSREAEIKKLSRAEKLELIQRKMVS